MSDDASAPAHAAKARRGEEGIEYEIPAEEGDDPIDEGSSLGDDDADEDFDEEYVDDDDEGDDGESGEAGEVPDVAEAMNDPMFRAMCNYMLEAANTVQRSTNLRVKESAFESLREWVWENLYLPRVCPDETIDDEEPDAAAL